LPVLLLAGLSPAQALATNKAQALASVASSAYRFVRAGYVSFRSVRWKIVASVIGASLGALTIRIADPRMLATIAPLLLICVCLFFIFSPNLARERGRARISETLFAFSVVVPISFYDGFFGPGTGSIYVAAFVFLLGRNLTMATAETKVLNASGSAVAAAVFIPGGIIDWPAAVAMSAGGIIGGQIGALLAIRWGGPLIRLALVAVSLALAIRLLIGPQTAFNP